MRSWHTGTAQRCVVTWCRQACQLHISLQTAVLSRHTHMPCLPRCPPLAAQGQPSAQAKGMPSLFGLEAPPMILLLTYRSHMPFVLQCSPQRDHELTQLHIFATWFHSGREGSWVMHRQLWVYPGRTELNASFSSARRGWQACKRLGAACASSSSHQTFVSQSEIRRCSGAGRRNRSITTVGFCYRISRTACASSTQTAQQTTGAGGGRRAGRRAGQWAGVPEQLVT